MSRIIELNQKLDRRSIRTRFGATGRVQIRDVLNTASAQRIQSILESQTPWGLAWQAGSDGPHFQRSLDVRNVGGDDQAAVNKKVDGAVRKGEYGYKYCSYPLVTSYLGKWNPGSFHDHLLEELNDEPFLSLIREASGISSIVKADGQATLYRPGDFLVPHDDAESSRGRKVAYVLNLTSGEWRPQWGGYLTFFNDEWDVDLAIRPQFNSLNLFLVPQWHSVSEVASIAPLSRYAITGWARDR